MNQRLLDVLKKVKKKVEIYTSVDGTSVLVLPYGGRILGLFAPNSEKNFYWTNPVLDDVSKAEAFFAGDQWQNTGGDRTWLAPEVDFFFPEFPSLNTYFQPRQLDPGNYQVIRKDGRVALVNELTVLPSRSKRSIDLVITKSLGPALNPLRYERKVEWLCDVDYAGYSLNTRLEMSGEAAKTEDVGLWNLVQMPHGGDLIVPTYGTVEPKVYFGEVDSDDLLVRENLLIYKMRALGQHKIGIRAVGTAGRVGYLYQANGEWVLIIRNFFVNPSGEYVDIPWTDVEYYGFSTQACNIKSELGEFSELEYHIPAIGKSFGCNYCEDTAQVWAFRGSEENIRSIGRLLLSPAI
jgi:hypothetical protein